MRNWLIHAEYLIWSAWAVKKANDAWRLHRPYRGETLIQRRSFDHHLFMWGVATKRIEDPGRNRDMPHSYYVSLLFRDDTEAVKEEARVFWHTMTKQRKIHAS